MQRTHTSSAAIRRFLLTGPLTETKPSVLLFPALHCSGIHSRIRSVHTQPDLQPAELHKLFSSCSLTFHFLFRIVSYMMIISFLSCFVNPNNAWYSLFSTFFIVFVLYFYSLSTIHVFANKKLSETHSLFPWIFIAFFTFFLYNEKGYYEQQRKKDAERSPNGYITGYC